MAIFDGNLKQRLIGALVLIVLAIVFLPMILNNKGEEQTDTVVTIPEAPTQPAATINQIPQSTAAAPDIITTTTTEPASINNTNAATPAPTPQTAINQPITTTTVPNTNEITPSWTIQVATGSIEANAKSLEEKLRKANYNAYTRLDGKLYRIFVGPFIQKNEAMRVQKSIEKQFKEKGIVKEFKPESN